MSDRTAAGCPQPLIIRNWGVRLCWALASAFWISIATVWLAIAAQRWLGASEWVFLGVVLAPVGYASIRAVRISVTLSDTSVTVRNFWHTNDIPIGLIAGIVPGRVRYPAPLACAAVRTADGLSDIPIQATASWGWRSGTPSHQSVRLTRSLANWSAQHGIRNVLSADRLYS